jgi:LysM repeat protein
MSSERTGINSLALLIGTVLVVLAFLTGTVFGTMVLGWKVWPSPSIRATLTASAVSAPLSGVDLATPTLSTGAPQPKVPSLTLTITPCAPLPAGWMPYLVKSGDTLSELALLAGVSQEQIMEVNCLTSPELWAGQALYLPLLRTPTPCGLQPAGWAAYTVKPGDTLSELATLTGVSQERLMQANCLTSPELGVGRVLYLPPLPTPTPTPCVLSPPPGWVLNVVQSGDTLSDLAAMHGTTVEKIMSVNCLMSPELWTGQGLYLPSLFPPVPVPATPPTKLGLDSHFRHRLAELDPLAMPAGGPNDSEFTPCATLQDSPWISVETESWPGDERNDLQHGQRAYYFACGFPEDVENDLPAKLTARMVGPNGRSRPLDVLHHQLNLDVQWGYAQGMVAWNATCDLDSGPYKLIFEDDQEHQASLSFNLGRTDFERILTVPQMGAAGTTFHVYYCGYDAQGIIIDLYYEVARWMDGGHHFSHADRWTVPINGRYCVSETLQSSPGDPGGAYLLQDRPDELDGWDMIWLIP